MEETNFTYFCYTKKRCILPNEFYFAPIQIGSFFEDPLSDFIHDTDDYNIGNRYCSYGFFSALYWIWRNKKCDYVGFSEAGLFFPFCDVKLKLDKINHYFKENFTAEIINEYCWNDSINGISENILPMKCKLNILSKKTKTIWDFYREYYNCSETDLNLIAGSIKKTFPEYTATIKNFFDGKTFFFDVAFILDKEKFDKFCKQCFSVLETVYSQIDSDKDSLSNLSVVELAGRIFFNIYFYEISGERQRPLIFIKEIEVQSPIKEYFPENAVPIVITFDDYYAPFSGVLIQSIVENSNEKNNYDIIILEDKISMRHKQNMYDSIKNKKNFSIRFFDVGKSLRNYSFHIYDYMTMHTCMRFFIADLLQDYHKAIYIDGDIVVKADIADLYNIDINKYYIAAIKDIYSAGWYNRGDAQRKNIDEVLKLKNPYNYFNAGVLVMNLDEFRKNFPAEKMLKITSSYKWRYLDQDVLNKYCEGHVKFIGFEWNMELCDDLESIKWAPQKMYEEYRQAHKNPKAIHYVGHSIPCYKLLCDFHEDFWKYARKTSFYEELLQRMAKRTYEDDKKNRRINKIKKIKKFINNVLPLGTFRRRFFEKIYFLIIRIIKK